jgi:hypothetical protein
MYDVNDDENRGPYYVPWKKSSMNLYNEIKNSTPIDELTEKERAEFLAMKRYKSMDGYIPGSTLGNVPTENKTEEPPPEEEKN